MHRDRWTDSLHVCHLLHKCEVYVLGLECSVSDYWTGEKMHSTVSFMRVSRAHELAGTVAADLKCRGTRAQTNEDNRTQRV